MTRLLHGAPRSSLVLGALLAFASGCRNDQEQKAEAEAKEALGIEKTGQVKTGETTRELVVKEDRTVVDVKTGKVLKEEHQATPVTIQTEVKKDVNVDVGATQKTATTP